MEFHAHEHKKRSEEEKKALMVRLRRIEGQVRGIEKMVEEVLANNQKMIEDYKAADEGRKPRVLKGIVGQVMKLSKGKANPEIVNELIMSKLN